MLTLALFVLAQTPVAATVTILPDHPLGTIPKDYTGLSYEQIQLADDAFFSPSNKELIALVKRLSPHGVLRLGANSSELGWWRPTPTTAVPPEIEAAVARTGTGTNRTAYPITPKAIDHLAGFVKATGWTLIYGLNFGAGTPARDAEEAAYVARKVGDRLRYFQIGNEPDLYTTAENKGRPKGWGFPQYVEEWTAIADAVSKRVPDARFGGPDVAGGSDWVTRFGQAVRPRLGARLATLSGHYYAMGPAGSKGATIENLLRPTPRVAEIMDRVEAVARPLGLTYRMTEGNTCYRGGQAGVSNALAASLWGADYELNLASHGGSGVNFHGGGGAAIAASLGNQLPGARNDADRELAKLGSFYSPIAGSREAGFGARPIFYGMMLAERFAGTTLLGVQTDLGGANATAYAARTDAGYLVALINKDAKVDLRVRIDGAKLGRARIWRLTGPSLDATTGVTFAGREVARGGGWRPTSVETSDSTALNLPRASAALAFIEAAR